MHLNLAAALLTFSAAYSVLSTYVMGQSYSGKAGYFSKAENPVNVTKFTLIKTIS